MGKLSDDVDGITNSEAVVDGKAIGATITSEGFLSGNDIAGDAGEATKGDFGGGVGVFRSRCKGSQSSVGIVCMDMDDEVSVASTSRLVDGVGSEFSPGTVLPSNGLSVTELGKKSMSENTCVLTGHIPVLAKPACIFRGVTATGKESRTILGMSYIVITFPGFDLIQLSQHALTAFFRGPNTLRSSGCILCVQ